MPSVWEEIQRMCGLCQGTGKIIPPHDFEDPLPQEIDCPQCGGEGYLEWGRKKEIIE